MNLAEVTMVIVGECGVFAQRLHQGLSSIGTGLANQFVFYAQISKLELRSVADPEGFP